MTQWITRYSYPNCRISESERKNLNSSQLTLMGAGITVICAKTGVYSIKYSPLRKISTPALGRKKENHSRDRDPQFLWFKLTWKVCQSLQDQLLMLLQQGGITSSAGFWIRWVTGGRNSDVICLSPEAKATAGQSLFLSAQDAAKLRLSGGRN